jgi:hypothetical protein
MPVQGRREGVWTERDRESGKVVLEEETYTCGHCQFATAVPAGQQLDDVGRFCLACMRPCCKQCSYRMSHGAGCDVWEKKHARAEAAIASRRSIEACL